MRGVVIAFCLAVLTAKAVHGAPLTGLPGSDDGGSADDDFISGGDASLLSEVTKEHGLVGTVDSVLGEDGTGSTLDSVMEEVIGENGTAGSSVGSVSGEDGVGSTVDSVLEEATREEELVGSTFLDSILEDYGGVDTADLVLGEDGEVSSVLEGVTSEDGVQDTLDSVLGDGVVGSVLGGVTAADRVEGTLDSVSEHGVVSSVLEGVTGEDGIVGIVDSILGDAVVGSVLEGITGGGGVEGTVDSVCRDNGALGSVLEINEGAVDSMMDLATDTNDDNVVGVVDPVLGSVTDVVEPGLKTVVSSEVLDSSGHIVQETASNVTDVVGDAALSTVLSNPEAVKVLVPVLRKLMTNKSALGTLVKIALARRLRNATKVCC